MSISPNAAQTKNIGETFTITPTVGPSNANNKNVNWTSSNTSVATVSATATPNGTAITVTCKAAGTAIVTATAADGSGNTTSLSLTVIIPPLLSQISANNYGDYVNYDVSIAGADNKIGGSSATGGTETPKTDWRIFYKDSTYVYLISTNYLPNAKKPASTFATTQGLYGVGWASSSSSIPSATLTNKTNFLFTKLSKVSTSNVSYKSAITLLDTNKWSIFVNSKADSAIGSPTIEMFAASWNAVNPSKKLYYDSNSNGYTYGTNPDSLISEGNILLEDSINTLYFPHKALWNNVWGYWFASPTSNGKVLGILNNGEIFPDYSYDNGRCVRPVVALKTDIKGYKDSNEIWQLEN